MNMFHCSNGMGKAAAIRLAEAGANICLVDLNKETGQQLADDLSKKHAGQKFIVSLKLQATCV